MDGTVLKVIFLSNLSPKETIKHCTKNKDSEPCSTLVFEFINLELQKTKYLFAYNKK